MPRGATKVVIREILDECSPQQLTREEVIAAARVHGHDLSAGSVVRSFRALIASEQIVKDESTWPPSYRAVKYREAKP